MHRRPAALSLPARVQLLEQARLLPSPLIRPIRRLRPRFPCAVVFPA